MTFNPGVRVGVYEIVSLIDTGGMGEVYRAHDPRLSRDVALKTLPSSSIDADRLQRFEPAGRCPDSSAMLAWM